MLQLCIDWIDLIKHTVHHAKVYNGLYAISDLHMRKKEWSVV
jgi:hypothetical protein